MENLGTIKPKWGVIFLDQMSRLVQDLIELFFSALSHCLFEGLIAEIGRWRSSDCESKAPLARHLFCGNCTSFSIHLNLIGEDEIELYFLLAQWLLGDRWEQRMDTYSVPLKGRPQV